jgi:uncharacterized lipoprotein YajG
MKLFVALLAALLLAGCAAEPDHQREINLPPVKIMKIRF